MVSSITEGKKKLISGLRIKSIFAPKPVRTSVLLDDLLGRASLLFSGSSRRVRQSRLPHTAKRLIESSIKG